MYRDGQLNYDGNPYHLGGWYKPSGRGPDVRYGHYPPPFILPPPLAVRLSEGSGRKQTNNQHQMTTVVSGGLPLQFWYQTSNRCVVHAFG